MVVTSDFVIAIIIIIIMIDKTKQNIIKLSNGKDLYTNDGY